VSVHALLEGRTKLNALLRKHHASVECVYVCASRRPRLGFDRHFETLDAIGRKLGRLGFKKLRQTASGFEFAAGVTLAGARELELAHRIVVTFERFFSFWAINEPFRILDGAEEQRRARTLKYREIVVAGGQLVVDGLQGRAPSSTIENALDALYRTGSPKDLKTLHAMFRAPAARSTSGTASRAG
jgi:hypothetical protein